MRSLDPTRDQRVNPIIRRKNQMKSTKELLVEKTKREYTLGRISDLPSIAKTYEPNSKPCKMCRKLFVYRAHNAIYCNTCKEKRKTLSNRKSKRRSRGLDVRKVDL